MPPPMLANIKPRLYIQAMELFIADDFDDINGEMSDPEDNMIHTPGMATEDPELAFQLQSHFQMSRYSLHFVRTLGV